MKPTKKKATKQQTRARETRRRLSLYDQAEAAERKLFDAEAVAAAARKFLEQAQVQVSKAQIALDSARDRLIAANDKRARVIGERVNKEYAAKAKKSTLDDVREEVRRGENTGPGSR